MTNKEFLQEVKASGIMPEGFEILYESFEKYQKMAIETLNEFHRVCVKNNVNYQLAYGSLLGAIRDNGQIPWDYDIDVFVPYEEKWKLIEALNRDLDSGFYYDCPENNTKCGTVILRVAPSGYRATLIHVDVFFLSGAPNDLNELEVFRKRLTKAAYVHNIKKVSMYDSSIYTKKHAVKVVFEKIKHLFESSEKAWEVYTQLAKQYPFYDSDNCVNANQFARLFQTDMLRETMLYKTTIGEFYVPVNYIEVLNILFKEYTKPLPLEKRINEVIFFERALRNHAKIQ